MVSLLQLTRCGNTSCATQAIMGLLKQGELLLAEYSNSDAIKVHVRRIVMPFFDT
jgi:hypothetical protein